MLEILDLQKRERWRSAWQALPGNRRSVFFLPEYYEIFEKLGYGQAMCAVLERQEGACIYPFLKKSLAFAPLAKASPDLFDIEGAYGMNGPGFSTSETRFVEEFVISLERYCASSGIMAEFTRFNPILENHRFGSFLSPLKAGKVVSVPLQSANLLYDCYEHSVRKNIKKSERLGITVKECSSRTLSGNDLLEFEAIYRGTMDRNNAADFYYFKPDFFNHLRDSLPDNSHWFFAIKDGRIVSVELVLMDEYGCYSFLGGTLPEFFTTGANVLLKHQIILHFRARGLQQFLLGGGHSEDDGIFHYKKNFSKAGVLDFFIGKRVHLELPYQQIIQDWERQNPEKKEQFKNILLRYRL